MIQRKMRRAAILVVCWAHLELANGAWALDTVNAWERWEKQLTYNQAITPLQAYRDVQIEATFWLKQGASCTEPATCTNPNSCFKGLAFWDGDGANPGVFKIRSAFPPGNWCWKTCLLPKANGCSSSVNAVNQSNEVTVSTTATNALYSNGFLKAPAGKRNLTTWNGQTIFQWIGDTAWNAPINYTSNRTTWANYVTKRTKGYEGNEFAGGGGFTNILVAPAVQTLANPPSGGFRGFIAPPGCGTGDRPVVPASCHYWDSVYWRDFDQMIKVANDKGIVIVVADVMDPLNRAGTNQNISPSVRFPAQADAKIFARNLTARLAGSFVVFSPSFDARVGDLFADGSTVAGLIDAVGTAIRSAAPRHLIGVHLGGGSALSDYDQFYGKPWFSLQLFQSGHMGGSCEAGISDIYAKFACRARKFALRFRCVGEPSTNAACVGSGAPAGQPIKPAVNVEGKYEEPGNNETRVQARHTAWNSGLSGSFGFNIGVWPDVAAWTNPLTYAATNHLSDDDLGRMKGLFKSRPWSELTPRHDLLVEQNNFSGDTCTNGLTSKVDWLQLWKPHLALDTAGGYGLAYLPRPKKCTLPGGSVFNTSTRIALDRAKANSLGISCATWAGLWVSPGPASPLAGGFFDSKAVCSDTGSGPVTFSVKQNDIGCGESCDRVLKLTRVIKASSNSLNAIGAFPLDLEVNVEISEDGQTSKIMGQLLTDGLPVGDPVLLNSPDPLFRKLPSAALDTSGNFLIAWEEENETGTDDILVVRVNPLLEPIGPPLMLNDTTDGQQAEPWASGDGSGDTVVAWTSYSEDDLIAGDIYVKVLDRFGKPVGSEILVSTDNDGNQFLPQVQMDGDGGFVVAWTSEPPADNLYVVPPDESSEFSTAKAAPAVRENKRGVYYRVFGANGRPRGSERRVSSGNPGQDRLSHLEVHRHGGFKIRWREFDAAGHDLGEREQEHQQDGNSIGRN